MPMLEAVRIVADWLADPTYGVSAKLAGVPRDGSDTVSATVGIEDETRNDEVARGRVPDGSTTVVIGVGVSSHMEGVFDTSELRPIKRDHQIPLLLRMRYVGEDSSTAVRDLYYVWRAVSRSLEELRQGSATAITARTRNSTFLEQVVRDLGVPLWSSAEDKQVILARQIVVQMRDNAPQS